MSSNDSLQYSDKHDNLVPSDQEGEPLTWDGNCGKILGLLDECRKHYEREGIFLPYIEHQAVLLSNGKTAISHTFIPYLSSLEKLKTRAT